MGRRLSAGAEVTSDGVHFRVYAPKRSRVAIVLEAGRRILPLGREDDPGHFAALVPGLRAGVRYGIRLDDDPKLYPDPASRFQPEGPHGPSEVVDPTSYRWRDRSWSGVELRGQVLYEMHVGTFTREGTWAAAARELEELKRVGITVVEMMPVADFAGRFGWGYDGVDLYAPTRLYGRPDDLRAFVDRAHELGLGVILDVVYNHLGPSGNYVSSFADTFLTKKYENEWGDSIDFETDPNVRAFFIENAGYWIDEYHFDGLRLDATQSIHDASERHVIAEIGERVRRSAGGRSTIVVAESEPCHSVLVRPKERGGYGLDAVWNDDFHHSARVAATGRREAYYSPLRGSAQELVSAVKHGPLFQGQFYPWQKQRRGAPALDIDAPRFVHYLENHDQIANSASGARLRTLTSPARHRALTALVLLAPGTPMLFQGQEFGATAPFLFFADHEPDLARLVAKGRREFLAQFPSARSPDLVVSPQEESTFERCKLDLSERETNRALYDFHRELLRLRREDPVFAAQRADWIRGAVLGERALVLRFVPGGGDGDRVVLVNLGGDLDLGELAEPLLAEPAGAAWREIFSTEDLRWGGSGTPAADAHGRRVLAAESALVLVARPSEEPVK